MHPKLLALTLSALLVGGAARPLDAQTLADVARREEERRKTVRDPAKVITNKDLHAAPAGAGAPAQTTTSATPATSSASSTTKPSETAKDSDKDKDQAYWSGRKKELQTQLDRDQTYRDALQTRVNALSADFVNRDDPAQRAGIERDRQKVTAELKRLEEAIKKDKKAIADFDDEVRRAGVPPGWLR